MDYLSLYPGIGLFAIGLIIALLPLSRTKALVLSALALVLIGASLFGIPSAELFAQNFCWDGLSRWFSLLILGSTFLGLILAFHKLPEEISFRKFVIPFFTLSALILFLASSQNLLYFVVLWSLAQVLFFFLLKKIDAHFSWSYLVLDLVSSALFLIGAGFLYALSGGLNLVEVKTNLVVRFFSLGPIGKILPVSLILITISLASKMGLFPFHFWLGNFKHLRNPLPLAVFTLLLRLGLLAFAIRFWLRSVAIYLEHWQFILIIGGVGSILWGGLALLIYRLENRSWYYLDLMQIGFLLTGICAAGFRSLSGSLFFLWGYCFSFWGLVLAFARLNLTEFDFSLAKSLIKRNKFLGIGLIIFASSLIGLPLTAGFWGKYNLLTALAGEKLWGLVGVGLLGTLLTLAYFVLIVKNHSYSNLSGDTQPITLPLKIGMAFCLLAILSVGLFPELILDLVLQGAASIPF